MTVKTNSGYNNYYFRKNIFGDIVGVYDPTKGLLATYTYDAFGNSVVEYTNTSNNKAYLNPFRYRGYYWDDELELYYLQSRYYDPEIGRFISPDSIEYINPSEIFGLNLYAYCNNNPIKYIYLKNSFYSDKNPIVNVTEDNKSSFLMVGNWFTRNVGFFQTVSYTVEKNYVVNYLFYSEEYGNKLSYILGDDSKRFSLFASVAKERYGLPDIKIGLNIKIPKGSVSIGFGIGSISLSAGFNNANYYFERNILGYYFGYEMIYENDITYYQYNLNYTLIEVGILALIAGFAYVGEATVSALYLLLEFFRLRYAF